MQKFLLTLLLLPAAYGTASGKKEDSVKVYQAKEVVVTATRSEISAADAPSPIEIITGESIQKLHVTDIADVLRIVDGIDLKDYGTIGGVKSAKLRGLSTENVLFLLNGNPINNVQNGFVDLSLLSTEGVERLEICYGGSSALYGGNALGGVVNIITRNASNDPHASVKVEGGSFMHRRIAAEVQGRVEGVGLYAGIARETGRDYFPYSLQPQNGSNATLYRKNADYQRWQLFLNGDHQFSDGSTIRTSIQYVDFKRGDPGSVNYPSIARLNDEVFRISLDSYINLDPRLSLRIFGIYNHSDELYSDPLDYTYNIKDYSFHTQLEWSIAKWERLIGGIEYNTAHLKANGFTTQYDTLYNPIIIPFALGPVRTQKSVFISNEMTIQNADVWFNKISFFQTIRFDSYSEIEKSAFSPKVGLNIRIYQPYNIRIRTSYGKNFRVPTFNDLYYPVFSNADLTPEYADAFDAGIVGSLDKNGLNAVQVTYFHIDSKDKIMYGPDYIPYNLGKAENSGYEIRYDYHSPGDAINAYFGYTFIQTAKKNRDSLADQTYNKMLSYVPESIGKFGMSFETEIGSIDLNHSVTGLRYTNKQNTNSLPAYGLTNMSIEKKIQYGKMQIILHCAVSNMFNVSYQVVEGYPMPGRAYRIGLGINY